MTDPDEPPVIEIYFAPDSAGDRPVPAIFGQCYLWVREQRPRGVVDDLKLARGLIALARESSARGSDIEAELMAVVVQRYGAAHLSPGTAG